MSAEPRRQDYPDHDAYLLAWQTWRAVQRDGRFNSEELDAYYKAKEDRVRQLFGQPTA